MDDLCLMIIHAHPDDECLTTGGVLARYSAEGVQTVLVTATGGEEGEIVVPELDTPENHARLRELRDAELACSVEKLGVRHLERLGYRDSGMAGTEANNHPACLHMADKERALERVVALVRAYRPHVLVSYDERGGYGHPDHIACHQLTVAAFAAAGDATRYPAAGAAWSPLKLYYTAFPRQPIERAWQLMREQGLPTPLDNSEFDLDRFTVDESRATTSISIVDYLQQKRDSIACHVTQIRMDGPFLSMPEEIARDLFGVEHFIRVAARVALPATSEREDDLFAGIREGR